MQKNIKKITNLFFEV